MGWKEIFAYNSISPASTRDTYGDGTLLYLNCGGGYTKLHVKKLG